MDTFVAGGLGGATGIVCTQPLDTVRVRLQMTPRTISISQSFRQTLKREGVRGLFKGVGSPLVTVAGMNAVLFYSYSHSLGFITSNTRPPILRDHMVAGVMSGVICGAINAPTELIKCRAQANFQSAGKIREEWEICRKLWRTKQLHRGLLLTVIRDTFSYGLYFGIYEFICQKFNPHGENSTLVAFGAGWLAGQGAWASIYPLDVIKTRWQTLQTVDGSSLKQLVLASLAREGNTFLVKGLGATLLRAGPQHAATFVVYERVMSMFS